MGTPCPTCNEARFDLFQNKGLQQPLYGFRVFCSNKESGCDWQGELGQLEEHVSTQCPLSYVKCEFSDAGCDAKVYRKDLPSHLEENMVTHMSLLARENRRLEEQDVLVTRENESLKRELKYRKEQIEAIRRQRDDPAFAACVPPIVLCSELPAMEPGMVWRSEPFYSGIAGYKLQFEVKLVSKDITVPISFTRKYTYELKCIVLDSEFVIPPSGSLQITSQFKLGTRICTDKHKIPQGRKESHPVSVRYTSNILAALTPLVAFQVKSTECLI